jgi:hypothetical protein
MEDTYDADQAGIRLPPVNQTRAIAAEEAYRAIHKHAQECSFAKEEISKRLRYVEISLARLVGFLIGSGVLGGIAGGLTAKLIP